MWRPSCAAYFLSLIHISGYECGMSIEKFNDIKEGDIFECFVMDQIKE